MQAMSYMLATISYCGYVTYNKLIHGPLLSANLAIHENSCIFAKGTSNSFECDGIRKLLYICERINCSILNKKLHLLELNASAEKKIDDDFKINSFCSANSLVWIDNTTVFNKAHKAYSMPIIDSLSSACIYRQTKVLSFSSYERHNFQLWSLIRGSVLEKIKSVLKSESIMDKDMHPTEWQAFCSFMDIFFVELNRNPSTLITFPMCFDLYDYLTADGHTDDLENFIIAHGLRSDSTGNQDILRCIIINYFPMSMVGAVGSSIYFTCKIQKVLETNKLGQYSHHYDARGEQDQQQPSLWHIKKFISLEKKLAKAYSSFHNIDETGNVSTVMTNFAKAIDDLLCDWYGSNDIGDSLCSDVIADGNIGRLAITGIATSVYSSYED